MSFPRTKKAAVEELDLETAGQMLNNVLDICNYERATVPLELLTSYSRYRKERYALQRVLIVVMLVLFTLLPLLFFPPHLTVTGEEDGRVRLTVTGLLPVQSVSARLNGRNVAVYDAGGGVYLLTPTANGELRLSAMLINRQYTETVWTVSNLDDTAPTYVRAAAEGQELRIYMSDDRSGIDPDGIYALLQDEETEVPVHWDAEDGCVVLDYPTEPVSLYVPDMEGNTLHLLLTPQ